MPDGTGAGSRFAAVVRALGAPLVLVGGAILSIWGAVTIVFFATRLLGDPATLLLPVGATQEQADSLRQSLGLNAGLAEQYGRYLLNLLSGDFGTSFVQGRPALELILDRLPATIALAMSALAIGVVVGGTVGTVAALTRRRWLKKLLMGWTALGLATPAFWFGIMLISVFAVQLGWFPTGGTDGIRSLALPALTLAFPTSASVARLLHGSVVQVERMDYVRTARAMGLPRGTIVFRHILRNALNPVLSLTGILAGELLGGSIVVETVFSWHGVGRLLIQSIGSRDFPVVQAAVFVIAVMYVLINMLIDALYPLLDPRVRDARRAGGGL